MGALGSPSQEITLCVCVVVFLFFLIQWTGDAGKHFYFEKFVIRFHSKLETFMKAGCWSQAETTKTQSLPWFWGQKKQDISTCIHGRMQHSVSECQDPPRRQKQNFTANLDSL